MKGGEQMQIRLKLTREENARAHGVATGSVVGLGIEDYLMGVVPAEIYESRTPQEAKKAQAIAARTYALRATLDGTTLTDTTKHQAYSAEKAKSAPNCARAVDDTAGMVLTFGGDVIRCYYSNSNGGRTKRTDEVWSAKLPYYQSRADPWDEGARRSAAAQGKTIKASHGVGLSQVGAEYAARLGEDCAAMLAFYYPGTEISYYQAGGTQTMLTSKQLAEYCLKVHAAGWVYWYGTCGYKCTTSLYNSKKKQYPDAYTAKRESGYKKDIANGCTAADCVGLIKSFFWQSGDIDGKSVRKANGCPDTNANGMYKLCSDNGPIATIPDVPGLVVWKSGHIGVYVGNGYTVEMKGFAYDCQKNKVTSGKWTNWGKLPATMLAYDNSELPALPVYKLGDRELRKGCEGDDVAELQAALVALGFDCGTFGTAKNGVDGDYGSKTLAAVQAFQQAAGLTVTGTADLGTIKVLAASAQAGQIIPDDEDGAPEDGSEPAYALGDRELRKGDKGEDVADLQAALVALGFDCGTFGTAKNGVDGEYGSKTLAAVKAMQQAAGVEITGIYDAKTHAALMAMREGVEASPDTFTVTIPNVDAATATYLVESYAGAVAVADGGDTA